MLACHACMSCLHVMLLTPGHPYPSLPNASHSQTGPLGIHTSQFTAGAAQEEEQSVSFLCFSFSVEHIAPLVAISGKHAGHTCHMQHWNRLSLPPLRPLSADTLTFFGSGMTVKFFTLFFSDKVRQNGKYVKCQTWLVPHMAGAKHGRYQVWQARQVPNMAGTTYGRCQTWQVPSMASTTGAKYGKHGRFQTWPVPHMAGTKHGRYQAWRVWVANMDAARALTTTGRAAAE